MSLSLRSPPQTPTPSNPLPKPNPAQNARNPELQVDAIDDDVHQWRVDIGAFDPASDLGRDMSEVSGLWGYESIRFVLSFRPDLHPFYPPRLTMARARAPARSPRGLQSGEGCAVVPCPLHHTSPVPLLAHIAGPAAPPRARRRGARGPPRAPPGPVGPLLPDDRRHRCGG